MRLPSLFATAICSLIPATLAASSWSFDDATLTIQGKGAGVGGGLKKKLSPSSALQSTSITLTASDTLKVSLTALEGKSGKKPHQAFLTFSERPSGLEESFPFSVKDGGKAKLEITRNDLPVQLATSAQPLKASIILASFGSSKPFLHHAFDLIIDPYDAPTIPEAPERYAAKPEIFHTFKEGPTLPPIVITLTFLFLIQMSLPYLTTTWANYGGNLDHLSKAFEAAPVAHGLFVGSIIAMEGVFFMYYTRWNLFQTLPVAAVMGIVALLSGSRALTEVQERRLAGER